MQKLERVGREGEEALAETKIESGEEAKKKKAEPGEAEVIPQ